MHFPRPSQRLVTLLAGLFLAGSLGSCKAIGSAVQNVRSLLPSAHKETAKLTSPVPALNLPGPSTTAPSPTPAAPGPGLPPVVLPNVTPTPAIWNLPNPSAFQMPALSGLGGAGLFHWSLPTQPVAGPVTINGRTLSGDDQRRVLFVHGFYGPLGEWWYDSRCGAFGPVGGPIVTILPPGLDLGPLDPNASRGTSSTYLNGRRLVAVEAEALEVFLGLGPGRYWVDHQGNFGDEGQGSPRFQFAQRLHQRMASQKPVDRERQKQWAAAWSVAYAAALQSQAQRTY